MTLDEYHAEWEQDAPLDLSNLDGNARDIYKLHAKWWKFYTAERMRFRKLDMDGKVLYRQRWEYWTGKLDDTEREAMGWPVQPLRILSANVSTYLDADPVIQAAAAKRIVVEEKLRFLEDVIKAVNNRNYAIKSAVDFAKFKMGV